LFGQHAVGDQDDVDRACGGLVGEPADRGGIEEIGLDHANGRSGAAHPQVLGDAAGLGGVARHQHEVAGLPRHPQPAAMFGDRGCSANDDDSHAGSLC
jgi:hypothetical protein